MKNGRRVRASHSTLARESYRVCSVSCVSFVILVVFDGTACAVALEFSTVLVAFVSLIAMFGLSSEFAFVHALGTVCRQIGRGSFEASHSFVATMEHLLNSVPTPATAAMIEPVNEQVLPVES
jgi:hypothetical protein